jgi:uncharacterized protein
VARAERDEDDRLRRLVEALRQPAAYPHPVGEIEVVETHISIVLLTGDYAYKLKKPVDLGFLDFTDLAARRRYCEEEVRLNRRTAPDLYLGVVPIRGTVDAPRIEGPGEILEHAVKMRQFPRGATLAERLGTPEEAPAESITALAAKVAGMHAGAPPAALDPDDYLDAIETQMSGNFHALSRYPDSGVRSAAAACAMWSRCELRLRKGTLLARLRAGRVREGHGDLHLGNVAVIGAELYPFDCVEFSLALRTADVISDACFLEMDLAAHGRDRLANRYLNAYLEGTGDYAGMAVRRLFLVYRALVRAKVAALAKSGTGAVRRYVQAATRFTRAPRCPVLILMHGLSGSGKSTVAVQLCEALGLVRIRSDVERKRLAGMPATERPAAGSDLYSRARSDATYAHLAALAGEVLSAGEHVVVDATFLAAAERARFAAVAARQRARCLIVHASADPATLTARIERRMAAGTDPSDADLAVLAAQRASADALTGAERRDTVVVDTAITGALEEAVGVVRARLRAGG